MRTGRIADGLKSGRPYFGAIGKRIRLLCGAQSIEGPFAFWRYPDVSLDKARARHKEARRRLADGIEPSSQKRALRRTFEIAAPE
ncbi:MAG: integrase arm-type DNA-binding domain-containing protein [Steroidobacter sp.]